MTIEFKAPEIGPNADALTSLTRGRGPRRGNLEDLLKYWRPIMKKPGGFRRCVVILMDKPQFGGKPQRICAWLHHELTGKWPNEGKGKRGRGKGKRKRRGRSVTRRVRSAGKKSLTGISPLTEVTSLRMTIRESREFGGILVQPIAGRKNAVEMKAAMFLQHSERLPLFAGNEVKRVGVFGSSSRLGQAAQAAGSIILPGDLSDIRSPIRSQIYETLTPGVPNIPNARGGRILRSRGRGARNKFRCPPGFEKGGTFTNSEFSTCGAQILGIATSGPGSPTPEANNRLSRLANTAGLVNEIGDLRNNDSAVDIIRAAQIPAAPKKGSPTRAETSIDLVLTRYEQEDFPTKVVRRDGVILEPVVSVEALGKLNEFDDMADGSLIERYEAGQIGASTVPAFSTNLRNVFVSIPDAGAVKISRVGGEISDAERAGLLRSFATGISRSADLPDPSAAVRAWADGSDGRFTVEFGEVTETGFAIAEGKNDLIKVSTAGGKTETVPRWVYETFLSRSAPRRAKDAPIYEIVAEEGAEEKSGSPFAFSQKSAPVATDFTDVLDAKYYHMSVNSKIEAFTSLTEIDFKAPRGRGLGRRIGRGGRAVGGRSRAVFDGNLGRYRCPPGTRYGGRFSNQFASNCGYSLPRQIVNNLVDLGTRLEDAMERRRRRRLDTSPGDGRSNLKPETAEKLDDAIRTLDAATGDLGRVFEKTEGVEGGKLGRTLGEAQRDVDLTPEERQLLEGEALEAALKNLRDVMNDQDLANANLDEIRKAYKAVEKAANTEAGRLSDNPPRTPEQRSRQDGILGFLRELILRFLGLWNEDFERERAGRRDRDVVPGDEGVPGGPGGGGPRRPRAPGVPGDGPDSRAPDGRTPDGRTPDPDDIPEALQPKPVGEMTDGELVREFFRLRHGSPGLLIPGQRDEEMDRRRLREINAELRRRNIDPYNPQTITYTPADDADDPEKIMDEFARILQEFRERAEEYRVSGGGRTLDFVESLDDDDLDKYINAFETAAEAMADNPQFDDIRAALERLRAERDRRNRSRSLVNANLRDRFDLETEEGMAEAIQHFYDLAEEYNARDAMTVEFIQLLNDDEVAFFQDVFDQAIIQFPEVAQRDNAFMKIAARLADERDRRDRLNKVPASEIKPEDYQRVLAEMEAHMERYRVAGGGMTLDFFNAISDDDLIKYRRAVRDAIDANAVPADEIGNLQELLKRMDNEFDRRFQGPGKRPRIESEENNIKDKFDLDENADLFAVIAEFEKRAADFKVSGGGMTQNMLETLSDDELDVFFNAHLRLSDLYAAEGREGLEDLEELIGRLAAERDRRRLQQAAFDPGSRSDPDSRSLRNVNNRFPRNGLPGRAYWRDDDYNGTDAAELDRRFGGYYDADGNLNDRGREVNRRLRPSDPTDPNAGAGGAPEPPDPNDPDVLDRFSDDELRALIEAGDDFPFNLQRISDDDLVRLDNITGEMARENINAGNLRNWRAIRAEYNALEDGTRDPNRLGVNVPGSASNRPQRLPEYRNDPGFNTQGRRDPVNMPELDNLTPEQIDNVAGAAVREHQEVLQLILNEVGPLQDGWNVADLEAAVRRRIEEEDFPQAGARLLTLRLQAFRELNQMVDGLRFVREEESFDANDTAARAARDLDVLKEYLPYLALNRREGIMNLRDNPDAALSRIDPDFEFLVDGAPSANRVVDEPEVDIIFNRVDPDYDDALNRYDADPDRFLSDLDLYSAGDLLDMFDARVGAGEVVDPSLRAALKARYADLLNINDGDVDDLARRMANMDDAMLDDMSPRDRALRQARLRAGNAGRPPSRAAAEQADRLRAADQRRADADRGGIPSGGPFEFTEGMTSRERFDAVIDAADADPAGVRLQGYLENMSPEEFGRFEREYGSLLAFAAQRDANGLSEDDVQRYFDYLSDAMDRERARRGNINRFQLDRDLQDRSDEALEAHIEHLQNSKAWGLDTLGRDVDELDALINRLQSEVEARRLRNLGSVTPDLVDQPRQGDAAVRVRLRDAMFEDNMNADKIPGAKAMLRNELMLAEASTNEMLRYRERILNSTNLSDSQKDDLMRSWNRAMRIRGDRSFERNLPLNERSVEAIDRHLEYVQERLDNMDPNIIDENGLLTLREELLDGRAVASARANLGDAVDNKPQLSDRWRKVGRWNFLKARRQRQQKREQKIKDIAERRYGDRETQPWDIGGRDGLSAMTDAQVESRIRDAFLLDTDQPVQVGSVEINGKTYTKQIIPTTDGRGDGVFISRDGPRGDILQIDVQSSMKFQLLDSDGNVVAEETYSENDGGFRLGRMSRTITWDAQGDGKVKHNLLGTSRVIQFEGQDISFAGGGFTEEMFNNNLLFYRNMGVSKVKVGAVDDGRVVWPRIGFRDDNPNHIRNLNEGMVEVLKDYNGYKEAKRTGIEPTLKQRAAKALIQDDVRAERIEAMVEPLLNVDDPVRVLASMDAREINELPDMHDFMLALEGEGIRNSVAFQMFRGGGVYIGRNVGDDPANNIGALDGDMVDQLLADDPELAGLTLPNPFRGTTFSDGTWDITDILSDADGDPRQVTPDLIDPYDRPPEPSIPSIPSVPSGPTPPPRQSDARPNQKLDPNFDRGEQRPLPAVPVGANGIESVDQGAEWMRDGNNDVSGVPDEFLNPVVLAVSDIGEDRLGQYSNEMLEELVEESLDDLPFDVTRLSDNDLQRLVGVVDRLYGQNGSGYRHGQAIRDEQNRVLRRDDREPNARFEMLVPGMGMDDGGGVNNRGNAINGAQLIVDTATGQIFMIKFNDGRSYGRDEDGNELVGRALMIRLGFVQGQMRLDGPANPNAANRDPWDDPAINPARGLMGEALQNYLPEGATDIMIGRRNPGQYDFSNENTLDDATHMMLGDALLFNSDRHGSNWLQYTDRDGNVRLVPIDMGLTLGGRDGEDGTDNDFFGVEYRDPRTGDLVRLSPEEQFAARAANSRGPRLSGDLYSQLAAASASDRAAVAASFDRALERLRAAQSAEDMEKVIGDIVGAHGNLDSDGWKRSQEMFLERYGWLMETDYTGEELMDLVLFGNYRGMPQRQSNVGL